MLDQNYLAHQLKWLIKLRWIAIIGALALAGVVRRFGYFDIPPDLLYFVLGFSALANILFAWTLRRLRSRLVAFTLVQVFADQATLGLLLYLSGACLSPFLSFFCFTS